MSLALAIAIGAGLFKAKAGMDAANAQADAYAQQSKIKKRMIEELEERNYLNNRLLERRGEAFVGKQVVEVGASGFDLSGSTLLLLTKTAEDVAEQKIINNMETGSEIGRLNAEITMNKALAQDVRRAGQIGAIADLLSLGAKTERAL